MTEGSGRSREHEWQTILRRLTAPPSRSAVATEEAGDEARSVLAFFRLLLRRYHPRDFALRLWDGTEWPAETTEPRFVWHIRHAAAPRRMFRAWDTDTHLGESYVYDDFDIEGDLEASFRLGDWLVRGGIGTLDRVRLAARLRRLPRDPAADDLPRHAARLRGKRHSRERDRSAITFHYDRSNEFFALWLDQGMVYSCGYFHDERESLDAAQRRKLDYVCRKLRLRPGDRLLDIGCGWGSLLLHAARRYGTRTLGITLSEAQAELARRRIARAGLTESCRVEISDYRDVAGRARFDKIASVGMVEHVGEEKLADYFAKAWELLRPGGAFLNHGIAWRASERRFSGESFDAKFVFPDCKLTTLYQVLRSAEEVGFEVRDVESLREHYALTLRHWVRRLERRRDEVREHVDEPTYRIWRLYMAGAAHAFSIGRLNVYQVLLVKPDGARSNVPLTRADWYAPEASGRPGAVPEHPRRL